MAVSPCGWYFAMVSPTTFADFRVFAFQVRPVSHIAHKTRRWTGFMPSRTSGRARATMVDIAYSRYESASSCEISRFSRFMAEMGLIWFYFIRLRGAEKISERVGDRRHAIRHVLEKTGGGLSCRSRLLICHGHGRNARHNAAEIADPEINDDRHDEDGRDDEDPGLHRFLQ